MKKSTEQKTRFVGIRMRPSLYAALEKEADRRLAPVSALVTKLIEDGIHTLQQGQF